MAVFIKIDKVRENDEVVVYRYTQPTCGPNPEKPRRLIVTGENYGEVLLNKTDGTLEWLSGQDWDINGAFRDRTCMKIARCYQAGEYPDPLYWAS